MTMSKSIFVIFSNLESNPVVTKSSIISITVRSEQLARLNPHFKIT